MTKETVMKVAIGEKKTFFITGYKDENNMQAIESSHTYKACFLLEVSTIPM